ncbi:ComF family protein [Candidatus Colwellia aromaticivorans]|uniref:ComF family protein n=1 Tax=Candidatus Colwellia aromaticivorans TaxID=2267621 RepID=UPI000DF3EF35|nr:ComF family protein [Candidatus Colwellia aromaticivorans]
MEWLALIKLKNNWQSQIHTYYQRILLIFSQCDLCGNATQQQTLVCSACLADLPLFKQKITQGDLLNWPAVNRSLPSIHFDHLFCLSPYLAPFNHWLSQLKYQGRFELASLFASLLAKEWLETQLKSSVDLILSVPLHISKWQQRGYNQAHLIAKPFSQLLQLPYQSSALVRIKKNSSQVGQTGAQRRNNLANAFALRQPLTKGVKHVMLIDDVLTTGSTASEISKLLKYKGVEKVTVVTVCLTLPKH